VDAKTQSEAIQNKGDAETRNELPLLPRRVFVDAMPDKGLFAFIAVFGFALILALKIFWGGRAGTQWWISPKKNTAGLIMAQRENGFAHSFAVEFKRFAYQAAKR
jgi:hypothetical protein